MGTGRGLYSRGNGRMLFSRVTGRALYSGLIDPRYNKSSSSIYRKTRHGTATVSFPPNEAPEGHVDDARNDAFYDWENDSYWEPYSYYGRCYYGKRDTGSQNWYATMRLNVSVQGIEYDANMDGKTLRMVSSESVINITNDEGPGARDGITLYVDMNNTTGVLSTSLSEIESFPSFEIFDTDGAWSIAPNLAVNSAAPVIFIYLKYSSLNFQGWGAAPDDWKETTKF